MTASRAESLRIAGALFAVYVIWGSTYFAQRIALAFVPPFLLAGPRFLTAGVLLFGFLRLRGAPMPTPRQWLSGGVVGVLLLVLGNGFVAIGQRSVDSGVAATIVATMPLWAAALGLVWGEKPSGREALGLLLGFAGVAILRRGGSLSLLSVDGIVLVVAPITWAFGSQLGRRLPLAPGLMASAVQMIVAGVLMLGIALALGERPHGPATPSALAAMAYLVVFGSLVAFSSYGFLLRNTRPAIATSYAYVNPVVALGLGAAFGGEAFTSSKVIACALTVVGVLIVTRR